MNHSQFNPPRLHFRDQAGGPELNSPTLRCQSEARTQPETPKFNPYDVS